MAMSTGRKQVDQASPGSLPRQEGKQKMKAYASTLSTKVIYRGKTWSDTIYGEYDPQVSIQDITPEDCERLAVMLEKAVRASKDLAEMVSLATLALGLKNAITEATERAARENEEAEARAAEARAAAEDETEAI